MAIQLTSYVDPGAYVEEVISPNALSIATVPQTLCIVAPGNALKRANNEAVVRGKIPGETLTVGGTSPHNATLSHTSTGLQEDSTLYEDGVPLSVDLWSFNSATSVRVADAAWTSGAVYTIDYVATDTDRDSLVNSDAREIVRVGSFASTSTFRQDVDYHLDDKARIDSYINDTYDLSTNNDLYLQIDSKPQISITVAGGAPAVSTAAEVVADINAALVASSDYGVTYGAVAEVYNTDQVRLTSPTRGATSQLRINSGGTNAAGAIFGITTFPFIANADVINWDLDQSAELIGVPATPFNLAAVATLNIAVDSKVGGALHAEWTTLLAGTYNTTTGNNVLRLNIDARGNIDITLSSGAAVTAATIASEINAALVASGTYGASYGTVATAVTNRVRLTSPSVGTSSSVEILNEGTSNAHTIIFELDDVHCPLLQKGDGTVACRLDVGGAITIAAVIADINARLADHSQYGSTYSTVAQNDGANHLRLLSPTQGESSKVRVDLAQTGSAHIIVLGLLTAQLPYDVIGSGRRPEVGSVYFTSYDYVRPDSDYNTSVRVFNEDQLYARVGDLEANNPLAIAGTIAFENDAPTLFVCQVQDANDDGAYSTNDWLTAIDDGLDNSAITEVCALSTNVDVQVALVDHVTEKSALTAKKWRRAWFGMDRGTAVGDIDTANTFLYRAKRTLQVTPDSPARGRLILCAPPNVSKTIRTAFGEDILVNLDSTYVSAAVAARHTSFTSVATSLLRKQITGFNTSDFQQYLDAERHLLAQSGVTVVTNDAGRLMLLDPITTEAGGGGLISFSEISAGAQKDNCVRAVVQAVDSNLVGIVPSDLSDFIFDIKTVVGGILRGLITAGSIGPFKDSQGRARDVNFASDIQVFQDATDPTKYSFRFFFNIRYPAKRLYGEFSVDNPFFELAA